MLDPTVSALRSHKPRHLALLQDGHALLITRAPLPGVKPAPGQPGAASDYVPSTPDIFVAVLADGRVMAFNGHVDLGTGIRTSLAQIVAEELDVDLARVEMVLGHTEAAPNQGPTIASATIQISAVPLRKAAAQARAWLVARAAETLRVDAAALRVDDGVIRPAASGTANHGTANHGTANAPIPPVTGASVDYWTLLARGGAIVSLAEAVALKDPATYRVVGQSTPRVDIPAKATGGMSYVHDVRVAGMRHGRVVRPPYPGRDTGAFIGKSLLAVDEHSVAGLPGNVRVVRHGDFVGVVADREEQAIRAARQLVVQWAPIPPAEDLSDLAKALRAAPSTLRPLMEQGDVDSALAAGAELACDYVWPYQMHASIGPSCAVADWRDEGLTVWSGTQNPHMLRIDLHRLLERDEAQIEIIRLEAAGCYGRNCADDVCADAALLSRAVGAPVRVQLSREQEHAWEPKGTAQLMTVRGAIDRDGSLSAYEFGTRYPSNDAPLLALLLTGRVPAEPRTLQMGDRTAVPPYRYASMRIACHDMPSIVRSSWLRGVSALPNSFAHDCFVDELAERAGQDPLAFRLRHLDDERAVDLLRAVAERAGWQAQSPGTRGLPAADGMLRGRGIAYARYIHSRFPGFGAAWSAWVVDLRVDPDNGRIVVERIVVGQDTGMMVNPDGVRHQIHGNVIQSLSRALKESVGFDDKGVTSLEWGAYPILGFKEVPTVDVVLMPRQDEPPMGAGESASVPGAAAIANALFDATGKRFRAPPFTPDRVLRVLRGDR
jgi:CO/xanthine dehydrogenase Mo-binding subunit